MKDTFDWFHKDPTKIIEKQGLISKTGLIQGYAEITGTTTGGITDENDRL